MRYDVASILPSLNRDTQRLFSVKHPFGEANIARNFLLLEDGYFYMTVPFMDCAVFEVHLINSLRFSEV